MVSPNKSVSREIDLFCFDQPVAESPDLRLPWLGSLYAPARRRRYHSTQLAIITGIFAGGGLICSLLLVDGNEEFPAPHHWLRRSHSSPVISSPHEPATAPSAPQNPPIWSNNEAESVLHPRQLAARKLPSHSGRIGRATTDLAFGFETKSSQCRLEEG
jgi:hypothetical protein